MHCDAFKAFGTLLLICCLHMPERMSFLMTLCVISSKTSHDRNSWSGKNPLTGTGKGLGGGEWGSGEGGGSTAT